MRRPTRLRILAASRLPRGEVAVTIALGCARFAPALRRELRTAHAAGASLARSESIEMHELALMSDLVDAVQERLGAARVSEVRLIVGKESGVLPDALHFCFEVCSLGTHLEGARLLIIEAGDQSLRLESVEVIDDVQDLRL